MADRSVRASRSGRTTGTSTRWSSRWTLGVIVLVLALVFVLENRQPVAIRLWIPVVIMPQWAALTIMLVLGGVTGALLSRRRR
ncbi:MAG: hypothetical protein K0S40_103 [Actinomycetospora sp.]|jgi:uncharacterized integral membrane protein|nr:hypothetical protein [Actinomycetospora sp.]